MRVLNPGRRQWILCFALVALFLAQSVVQLHALRHLGDGPGGPVVPAQHSQLCTDCISHATLLLMAGGAAIVIFIATHSPGMLLKCAAEAVVARRPRYAFRSRAPPR